MQAAVKLSCVTSFLAPAAGTTSYKVSRVDVAMCVQVYAFEFLRENVQLLKSTLVLNNFKGHVEILHAAVSDRLKHHVSLAANLSTANRGGQAAIEAQTQNSAVEYHETLPMVRIDDVVKEHVNFMKMDCQGCEYQAILGAEKLFKEHGVDYMYFEFSGHLLPQVSDNPHAPELLLLKVLEYGMDIWVVNDKYTEGKGFTVLSKKADVERFLSEAPYKKFAGEEMDMYGIPAGTAFPAALRGHFP